MAAYVGQNYGAGKNERIHKGVKATMVIASCVGIFSTLLLILAREPLMHMFVADTETVKIGMNYLMILGYSQLFMCMEITIRGAFNGLGRTFLPNIVSIVLTGARIPLALYLSEIYGLNGVWISISGTSVLKGIILVAVYFYLYYQKKLYKTQ